MILSPKALIERKAEYLMGRALSASERKSILKAIKVGNNKEIRVAVAKYDLKNSFQTIEAVVAEHTQQRDLSKLSKDELIGVVQDVVVRTASVQAGLRILRHAAQMQKDTLLKYIYELYLRDAMAKDRVKKANKDAITNDQAHRPERTQEESLRYTFENADKEDSLTDVKRYTMEDGRPTYLADEFRTGPSHNEPKGFKDKIKLWFKVRPTKDTGGSENEGNAR